MKPDLRLAAAAALVFLATAAAAQAQTWAVQINNANRFVVLPQFNSEAVLDRETGLVWERTPGQELYTWSLYPSAHLACNLRWIGNRLGWRLPTIQELGSLIDGSRFAPNLPAGHPFVFTPQQANGTFWSANSAGMVDEPNHAWFLWFLSGSSDVILFGGGDKTQPRYVWCVRGYKGTDVQ